MHSFFLTKEKLLFLLLFVMRSIRCETNLNKFFLLLYILYVPSSCIIIIKVHVIGLMSKSRRKTMRNGMTACMHAYAHAHKQNSTTTDRRTIMPKLIMKTCGLHRNVSTLVSEINNIFATYWALEHEHKRSLFVNVHYIWSPCITHNIIN